MRPAVPGWGSVSGSFMATPSVRRRSTSGCGAAVPLGNARSSGSALALGDLLGHRGEDGVQVADDTEVDELEDRGLVVLVDRHDGLRGLHPGAVLDGTGDAVGDVELGGHDLAGLAD